MFIGGRISTYIIRVEMGAENLKLRRAWAKSGGYAQWLGRRLCFFALGA